jgi:hypothetical protein
MLGSGGNQTTKEIAAKGAQERQLKEAQAGDLTGKAPSRSNGERSDDSSSDTDLDSDSSDEEIKDGDDAVRKAAKKRRKDKRKKQAKKMAKNLLKKMIKKEQAKYSHSGYHEVPHNYAQFPGNHPNENSILCIWKSLLISMGRTIPNGLMICTCTFTGFTPLFGRLWL